VAVALFLLTPAQAQDVTVQQLIDDIFAGTNDPALDLDGDGYVDVADIVCWYNSCHKDVRFSTVGQTVDEEAGTIQVHVEFERPLATTLYYSISGTATTGTGTGDDFTDPNGGVLAVNGSSADIPIEILNDDEVDEEIETILLRLQPGAGYRVSGPSGHTVTINDNDASWHGVLSTAEGRVAIVLELVNADGTYSASLRSDRMGTLPCPDTTPTGDYCYYPHSTVEFLYDWDGGGDDDVDGDGAVDLASIHIQFVPVDMDATSTSLGLAFSRQFTLDVDVRATCSLNPTVLCLDDTQCTAAGAGVCEPYEPSHYATDGGLAGDFTENVVYASHPHLNRDLLGEFGIGRKPSAPSSVEAELYAGTCSDSGYPCNDDDDCPGGATDTCVLP
jgi:hypothetical protein